MEGDGMVAMVRGLRESGLTVTLLDGNRQYTLMPNSATRPPSTQRGLNASTHLGPPKPTTDSSTEPSALQCDRDAQVIDGRYASMYKTMHCNLRPTSPPVQLTEFPPQRPEYYPGHGNFLVGGAGSGNYLQTRANSPVSSFRGGLSWPDRGSVCSPQPSQELGAFAKSLRKYPCLSPDRSSEVMERLVNYSHAKGFSKNVSRMCSPTRISEPSSHHTFEAKNTYTRNSKSYEPEVSIRSKKLEDPPTRDRKGDHHDIRSLRNCDLRYVSMAKSSREGVKGYSSYPYSYPVGPTIKEDYDYETCSRDCQNSSNSVDMEIQAAVKMISKEVATVPREHLTRSTAAVFESPISSAGEDNVEGECCFVQNLGIRTSFKSVKTNFCPSNTTLKPRKSAQIVFSTTDFHSRRNMTIVDRKTKSHEQIKATKDELKRILLEEVTVYKTKSKKTIRDELVEKLILTDRSEGDDNKHDRGNDKHDMCNKYVSTVLPIVCDYVGDFQEVVGELKHCHGDTNHEIRSEINCFTISECAQLDCVIKDWIKNLKLKTRDLARYTDSQILNSIEDRIKKLLKNWALQDFDLKSEIVNILEKIPIEINKGYTKKSFLHKLADVLLKRMRNVMVGQQSGKIRRPLASRPRKILTEEDMRDIVSAHLIDFVEDCNLKLCGDILDDLENELAYVMIESIEHIYCGYLCKAINEMNTILKDLGQITDKQANYISNIILQDLQEILNNDYWNQTYMIYNVSFDTGSSVGSLTDENLQLNLDHYTNELCQEINKWLDTLNIPRIQDTGFREVVVNDLAGDIVDRHKYTELNYTGKSTEKDQLEALKYQIFKWINKLVGDENQETIGHANDLLKRINNVPVPTLINRKHRKMIDKGGGGFDATSTCVTETCPNICDEQKLKLTGESKENNKQTGQSFGDSNQGTSRSYSQPAQGIQGQLRFSPNTSQTGRESYDQRPQRFINTCNPSQGQNSLGPGFLDGTQNSYKSGQGLGRGNTSPCNQSQCMSSSGRSFGPSAGNFRQTYGNASNRPYTDRMGTSGGTFGSMNQNQQSMNGGGPSCMMREPQGVQIPKFSGSQAPGQTVGSMNQNQQSMNGGGPSCMMRDPQGVQVPNFSGSQAPGQRVGSMNQNQQSMKGGGPSCMMRNPQGVQVPNFSGSQAPGQTVGSMNQNQQSMKGGGPSCMMRDPQGIQVPNFSGSQAPGQTEGNFYSSGAGAGTVVFTCSSCPRSSAPLSTSVRNLNEDYDNYLKQWVQQIPITARTPAEHQAAETARLVVYNGIWKGVTKMKLDPSVFSDPYYCQDLFEEEIERLLENISKSEELEAVKPTLKAQLLQKTLAMAYQTKCTNASASYKQQLTQNIENNLPGKTLICNCVDRQNEELEKQNLVDNYILYTRYRNEDNVKETFYKNNFLSKLDEFLNEIKKRDGLEHMDTNAYAYEIIDSLDKIPKPNVSTIKDGADEILLALKVEKWIADIPQTPNTAGPLEKRRTRDAIVKKIQEIGKSVGCCNSFRTRLKAELPKYLEKIPIQEGTNVDDIIDELVNSLTNSSVSIQQVSFQEPQDYSDFSRNMPASSSFNELPRQGLRDAGLSGKASLPEEEKWHSMDSRRPSCVPNCSEVPQSMQTQPYNQNISGQMPTPRRGSVKGDVVRDSPNRTNHSDQASGEQWHSMEITHAPSDLRDWSQQSQPKNVTRTYHDTAQEGRGNVSLNTQGQYCSNLKVRELCMRPPHCPNPNCISSPQSPPGQYSQPAAHGPYPKGPYGQRFPNAQSSQDPFGTSYGQGIPVAQSSPYGQGSPGQYNHSFGPGSQNIPNGSVFGSQMHPQGPHAGQRIINAPGACRQCHLGSNGQNFPNARSGPVPYNQGQPFELGEPAYNRVAPGGPGGSHPFEGPHHPDQGRGSALYIKGQNVGPYARDAGHKCFCQSLRKFNQTAQSPGSVSVEPGSHKPFQGPNGGQMGQGCQKCCCQALRKFNQTAQSPGPVSAASQVPDTQGRSSQQMGGSSMGIFGNSQVPESIGASHTPNAQGGYGMEMLGNSQVSESSIGASRTPNAQGGYGMEILGNSQAPESQVPESSIEASHTPNAQDGYGMEILGNSQVPESIGHTPSTQFYPSSGAQQAQPGTETSDPDVYKSTDSKSINQTIDRNKGVQQPSTDQNTSIGQPMGFSTPNQRMNQEDQRRARKTFQEQKQYTEGGPSAKRRVYLRDTDSRDKERDICDCMRLNRRDRGRKKIDPHDHQLEYEPCFSKFRYPYY